MGDERYTLECLLSKAEELMHCDGSPRSVEEVRHREIELLMTLEAAPPELSLLEHTTHFLRDDIESLSPVVMAEYYQKQVMAPAQLAGLLHTLYTWVSSTQLVESLQTSSREAGVHRIQTQQGTCNRSTAVMLFGKQVERRDAIPLVSVYDLQLRSLYHFEERPSLLSLLRATSATISETTNSRSR